MSGTRTFDRDVRAHYPQPIAAAWHRVHLALHAAEQAEAVAHFADVLARSLIAFVAPDYLRGPPHPDAERSLARLSRPSLGVLVQAYRHFCSALLDREQIFCPEAVLYGVRDGQQGPRELDTLVELRNRAAHGSLSLAERATLTQDLVHAAREALRAMPWLAGYRIMRVVSERSTREGGTRGKLQFFVGRDAAPEPLASTWSAPLSRDTVYLCAPSGRTLLDLYPWLRVEPAAGASQERIFLWKTIRDLVALQLVDDESGQSHTLRPSLGGKTLPFQEWLAARSEHPAACHDETLAVAQCQAPPLMLANREGEVWDDRYEVRGVLGEGGMASVYRCYDRARQTLCALKVMRPSLAGDPEFRERFTREVKALHALAHPRIVPIEDAFVLPDGRYCLRMPIFEGGSLAARVRVGGAPLPRVMAWARDALEGLVHLHARDFVHRDIKPSNLLIDADDRLVLADFGVVFQARDPRVTRTLEQVGTTAYLAPEQRRGGEVPTGAADIYALALVLHEVLTGDERATRPGQGVAGPFGELLRRMSVDAPHERPDAATLLEELAHIERSGRMAAARGASRLTPATDPLSSPHNAASPIGFAPRAGRAARLAALLLALLATGAAIYLRASPRCGDGIVGAGEDCDDGNAIEGDGCTTRCTSNWARLPAGTLWMGYREEELATGMPLVSRSRRPDAYILQRARLATPATPVMFRPFEMLRTEVSQGAFADFLSRDDEGALRAYPRSDESLAWHRAQTLALRARERHRIAALREQPTLPVAVNAESAALYCAFLGGMVPTEAHWEYAARGPGVGRTFPWGDAPLDDPPASCARFTGFFAVSTDPLVAVNCGDRQPSPVGAKAAGCTPEGICDLAGNQDEWVQPGPVRWREAGPELPGADPGAGGAGGAGGEPRVWASLPGPIVRDPDTFEFLVTCEGESAEDPFGLRTGQVRDCATPVFGGDPGASPAAHPRHRAYRVLRGGNFDDSLPLYYQSRARYPTFEGDLYDKGFRCMRIPEP